MNKMLFGKFIVLSAILLIVALTVFPVLTGSAADTTPPCKDGTCKQTGQLRAEWKAIYAYRIDSDVVGAAGDVLSYLLLRDQSDKDAFYQKMLSFHQIAKQYRELAKVEQYRAEKATEAYFRLCNAQERFETTAKAIIDAASKESKVTPQQLTNLEYAIDDYAKAGKSMKEALLSGITPETVKKDSELHAMLGLAEAMATALDGVQQAYAYMLTNGKKASVDFFAKMAAFNTALTRYKELASIGREGKEKRTGLYNNVLKARDDLVNSAKKVFASSENAKIPPTVEILAFKKDAGHLVFLVEELIDLMGAEGVSPCSTR